VLGCRHQLAQALLDAAVAARLSGDTNAAFRVFNESLAIFENLGLHAELAAASASLAHLHLQRGSFASAAMTLDESLRALCEEDSELGVTTVLTGLGLCALRTGRVWDAAQFLGQAERLLDSLRKGPITWTSNRHRRAPAHTSSGATASILANCDWLATPCLTRWDRIPLSPPLLPAGG
jgi:hypothetical protein